MVKITVQVEGMKCPMCEAHANEAIKTAMKVEKVTSSHMANETVIIAEEANEAAIKAAIEGCGYQMIGLQVESYEKKSIFARLFKKQ